MSVFLTGAGGFLGREIAMAAAREGHSVMALHRPAAERFDAGIPKLIAPVSGDLREPGAWRVRLADADCVVHCAAATSGDLATQLGGTVLATENLLAALPAGLRRFIHISSFSVYDFSAPPAFGTLDESTPLERRPLRRDAYTQTKLVQERMVREHCLANRIPLVVIRPGAIFRRASDWDYGRTLRLGPLDLIFAPFSSMRLVRVEECARAVIAALDAPVDSELIVNIVDDDALSYWDLHRRARMAREKVGIPVPVPYAIVRLLGGMAWLASWLCFRGRARLPEWLDLPRQQVRWRPLRYANSRAKARLGWNPAVAELGW